MGAPGVLENDADMGGDTLRAAMVSDLTHGELCLRANGFFSLHAGSWFQWGR